MLKKTEAFYQYMALCDIRKERKSLKKGRKENRHSYVYFREFYTNHMNKNSQEKNNNIPGLTTTESIWAGMGRAKQVRFSRIKIGRAYTSASPAPRIPCPSVLSSPRIRWGNAVRRKGQTQTGLSGSGPETQSHWRQFSCRRRHPLLCPLGLQNPNPVFLLFLMQVRLVVDGGHE